MKVETAIQYFDREIRFCERAPALNGCEMTGDWLLTRDACKLAVEALREKQERMNPKPLTLEEMLELDGEPVWTETIGLDRTGRWELIICETVCACPLEQKLRSVTFAGDVEWYPLETYGKTWIAYRHKPEEVEL